MRHVPDTIVTSGLRTGGKCREKVCKAALDFRLNVKTRTWLPFRAGAEPLHNETDERGVRYQQMSNDDLHFVTCRARRQAPGARA